MKGIDPKYIMWLGFIIYLEKGIGQGAISLTNMIPASWIPVVLAWCNGLAWGGVGLMTTLAAFSSNATGPFISPPSSSANVIPIKTDTIVKILLIAFLPLALLASGEARAQIRLKPLPDPLAKIKQDFQTTTGVKATGDVPFDLLKALDKALLPDLQYAQKLALATGSKVTAPCYQAWIDMINTQQTAVQTKNADGTTTDIVAPDPHLVTDFERMVELRNALQPDSPFMTACSPVANMVKMDVTNFMGIVISGGAGLATLVPGL